MSRTSESDGGSIKPVPDPTTLTTEQLIREITVPNTLQHQLTALQDLTNEKFASVDAHIAMQFENVAAHFALIERQRVEQKQDTRAAVESALDAAQEAVKEQTIASDRAINKSDAATAEQFKQLGTIFSTANAAVGGSIGDAKERITVLESLRTGGKENLSGVYTLIGVLMAVALLALGVLNYLNS